MMRRTTAVVAVVVILGTGCQAEAGCRLRIVNYNIAKLNSENPDNRNCVPGSLSVVFAALNDDDKPGFATAPHVYVCQEVPTDDAAVLLDLLNAAAPSGITYVLGTYTSNGETTGAQAMYYRNDTLVEIANEHADIPTGAGREADRWKLELVGKPEVAFYIYSAHLPASEGGAACGAFPPGTGVRFLAVASLQ